RIGCGSRVGHRPAGLGRISPCSRKASPRIPSAKYIPQRTLVLSPTHRNTTLERYTRGVGLDEALCLNRRTVRKGGERPSSIRFRRPSIICKGRYSLHNPPLYLIIRHPGSSRSHRTSTSCMHLLSFSAQPKNSSRI